jgi:hypothetical protein
MREPFNPNSGRFGLLPSVLEEFFQPSNSDARGASFTRDIEETESAYQLTVDLPELEKSDINIDLHENTRTISAERKEERPTEGASCGMSVQLGECLGQSSCHKWLTLTPSRQTRSMARCNSGCRRWQRRRGGR